MTTFILFDEETLEERMKGELKPARKPYIYEAYENFGFLYFCVWFDCLMLEWMKMERRH